MLEVVKMVSFDPSMSNFGIALMNYYPKTNKLEIEDLKLIVTESESKKNVIKVSDNLRRAKDIQKEMIKACEGRSVAVAEIPLMITSQNPRIASLANYNSGAMVGLLSSVPIPLIQVFPKEVKIAGTGIKDASKEEMIEAAISKYPEAPWLTRKLRGKIVPTKANEHLADAVFACHAGLKTDQFKGFMSIVETM